MNLRPFKLYHVCLEPLNLSNVGDFSKSWILKGFIHVQIEKEKFVVVCPRPPQNVALGGFTSQSCSRRQRNVLKSVMYVQRSCFADKTNCFFTLLFLWSSSLLWVPKDFTELTVIYTQFTRAKKIGMSRQIFCIVLTILRHGTPNFRRVNVSVPDVMWHQFSKF